MTEPFHSRDTGATSPRPKKSLGQNFLQDRNTAEKIVDSLAIERGDSILEIGPGPGALTRLILRREPARFIALEKDEHWAGNIPLLAAELGFSGSVEAVSADALAFEWESLQAEQGWKIIGNLPYNVASPLMWEIASRAGACTSAVFMVQKEVARRVTAEPGNSEYGALSVWLQSFMDTRYIFTVGPKVFFPRPKVDSGVILLRRREFPPAAFSARALSKTLRIVFQQRRKQLQRILKGAGFDAATVLDSLKIPHVSRPEALTVQEFHVLSKALFPND